MKKSIVSFVMVSVFLFAGIAFAGSMMMDKDMMMEGSKMMMDKGGMEKN